MNSFLSSPGSELIKFISRFVSLILSSLSVWDEDWRWFLDFFPLLFRYVAQGKGILQPHVLIDELDNVFGDDEARQNLRDGPFSEVIKSAQVNFYLLPFDDDFL